MKAWWTDGPTDRRTDAPSIVSSTRQKKTCRFLSYIFGRKNRRKSHLSRKRDGPTDRRTKKRADFESHIFPCFNVEFVFASVSHFLFSFCFCLRFVFIFDRKKTYTVLTLYFLLRSWRGHASHTSTRNPLLTFSEVRLISFHPVLSPHFSVISSMSCRSLLMPNN